VAADGSIDLICGRLICLSLTWSICRPQWYN